MRTIIFLSTLALGVFGCDFGQKPITPVELLSANIRLTDTSGRETTTFRPNENFDVSFTLTNTTDKRLTFYRGDSGPAVIFQILQGDKVVASSIDGYIFLPVAFTDYLEPGQTMRGYWRGPTTPAQYPRLLLTPGSYKLVVLFPRFDQAETKDVLPIQFSIVE